MNTKLHRPEPIFKQSTTEVKQKTLPRSAANRLMDGEFLLVSDFYSTGADILDELHYLMRPPPSHASYKERQQFKREYRETSMRLLVAITNNTLSLKDGRSIGFLKELYPECKNFLLPFVQVQELYGAWTQYSEGVHLAVLGYRVHPFLGTYVPTRTSHLEVFGTWLSQYKGLRKQAIDVGTGCGVLAFMLSKSGFESVLATDNNPNAIESVSKEIALRPIPPEITLLHADLLGKEPLQADLIVFNPPWLKGDTSSMIDGALFFEDNILFERFFESAHERLKPDGRIVMLFSNIMQLLQPHLPHPILTELDKNRFSLVQKMKRRVKPTPDKNGRIRKTKEQVEVWELSKV